MLFIWCLNFLIFIVLLNSAIGLSNVDKTGQTVGSKNERILLENEPYESAEVMFGDAIEAATPAICINVSACGFRPYGIYIDPHTGKLEFQYNYPFIHYCDCPDGQECVRGKRNQNQKYYYYECKNSTETEQLSTDSILVNSSSVDVSAGSSSNISSSEAREDSPSSGDNTTSVDVSTGSLTNTSEVSPSSGDNATSVDVSTGSLTNTSEVSPSVDNVQTLKRRGFVREEL